MAALYYPPPPPFVGGTQPLAPRELPPALSAVPEDDPPFSQRGFGTILLAWRPEPGLPRRGAWIAQGVAVDDPPFGLHAPFDPILAAWQPGPGLPWRPIYVVPFAAPDNPPFGIPSPSLWTVLTLWQPGPLRAQWGAHAPLDATAVPEHDPPFGLRTPLGSIFVAWQPPPPLPWRGLYIVQGVVQQPVFGICNADGSITLFVGSCTVTISLAGIIVND